MEQANPGKGAVVLRAVLTLQKLTLWTALSAKQSFSFRKRSFLQRKMVATRIQVYIILMTLFTGKYFLFVKSYMHLERIACVVAIQTALFNIYVASRNWKGGGL